MRQQLAPAQPRLAGPTIEQRFLAACREGREQAERVLHRWRDHLRVMETAVSGEHDHPFRSKATCTLLPADHLDLNLGNFIDTGGSLEYVDAEWAAPSAVDAHLVLLRALWGLAADIVRRGTVHPWSADATVDELALTLCASADVPAGTPELDRWRLAEADLLSSVQGGSVEDHLVWLRATGAGRQASPSTRRMLPFTTLRRELAICEHRLRVAHGHLAATEAEAASLRRQLDETRARLAASSSALEEREGELAALTGHLDVTRRALAEAEAVAASPVRRAGP